MTTPPLTCLLHSLLTTWLPAPTAHIPPTPAAGTATVILVLMLVVVTPARARLTIGVTASISATRLPSARRGPFVHAD